jgi:hypothetical protein
MHSYGQLRFEDQVIRALGILTAIHLVIGVALVAAIIFTGTP